jgi:hsp70-interacting protein
MYITDDFENTTNGATVVCKGKKSSETLVMNSKLLDWATRNASPENNSESSESNHEAIKNLDPEIIEMILGRDEAVVMKSLASRIGNSRTSSEDERIALEQLEEIVENIDSANNMAKMGLWNVVFEALALGENTPTALSVIGTSAQNNPEVQNELSRMGALHKILDAMNFDQDPVVMKAVFATSSMIQNNRPSFDSFCILGGIDSLLAVKDEHPCTAPRVQFLLETLGTLYPDVKNKFK